ncbi:MAG: LysM peptidoglycan-binding domain-containing protein [Victivallaceae bacterium]|nr:LysM peptidoglycan-binding domain-containing protein [Victivallaceae bacterium]
MKVISVGFCGAGALLLVAGCAPELDRINYGEDETEWGPYVKGNYSNFKPSKTPAAGVVTRYKNQDDNKFVDETPAAAVETPAVAGDGEVVETTTVETTMVETETPAVDAAAPAADAAADTAAPAADKAAAPAADAAAPAADKAVAPAADAATDTVYVVMPGDTLSHIAKRFYKDARMSDVILKANGDVLTNANKLRPGMKLRIPRM